MASSKKFVYSGQYNIALGAYVLHVLLSTNRIKNFYELDIDLVNEIVVSAGFGVTEQSKYRDYTRNQERGTFYVLRKSTLAKVRKLVIKNHTKLLAKGDKVEHQKNHLNLDNTLEALDVVWRNKPPVKSTVNTSELLSFGNISSIDYLLSAPKPYNPFS